METTTFEYFDKSFENYNEIKNFIIKQGKDVCKSKIKNSIDNFSYGFIIAQIGQKYIYSFILCKKDKNYIKIDLICSRPNSKEGLELMNIVENKAKEEKNNVI